MHWTLKWILNGILFCSFCLNLGIEPLTKLFDCILRSALSLFSSQVAKLRLLKKLDLSNNNIKEIPEEFSRLKNLVEFYLQNNQITELGDHVSEIVIFLVSLLLCYFYAQNFKKRLENIGSIGAR